MERAGLRVLMFTDIEGSTALLQRLGPQYVELIARYDALVRASVEQRGGTVVGAEGDGYFLTFDSANDGLDAALDMQLAVGEQTWPQQSEVRVRMGLHVGDVLETSTGAGRSRDSSRGPDRGRSAWRSGAGVGRRAIAARRLLRPG